jgi:hypothetical protein
MNPFQLPVEPHRTEVATIVELTKLLEMSYSNYDADDESPNSSGLGGADGKPPVNLKETEFSLKDFAKWMGQANYCAFNKWKKVWVAGFLEKQHRPVLLSQNRVKLVHNEPPQCE